MASLHKGYFKSFSSGVIKKNQLRNKFSYKNSIRLYDMVAR